MRCLCFWRATYLAVAQGEIARQTGALRAHPAVVQRKIAGCAHPTNHFERFVQSHTHSQCSRGHRGSNSTWRGAVNNDIVVNCGECGVDSAHRCEGGDCELHVG